MKPQMTNMQDIINGCIKGDRLSQNAFYDMTYEKSMKICMKYMRTKEKAEDALQEGYSRAFLNIHKFKNLGPIDAWVYKIMINTCLGINRREVLVYYPGDDKISKRRMSTQPEVYDIISNKEVLTAIQKLPPGYRSIITLYLIDGLSHDEISRKLKISEGTSKSQLSRAKRKLQENLS